MRRRTKRIHTYLCSSGGDLTRKVFSCFGESVKKWRDLNLSATFTEFYGAVLPVSESLPQVIHHQDKIMSLLEEYISRQDALALVSLLEYFHRLSR